jgi:hypothetical protein
MKPLKLARILRSIASSIQTSKNPSKILVIQGLKKILVAIDQTFPKNIMIKSPAWEPLVGEAYDWFERYISEFTEDLGLGIYGVDYDDEKEFGTLDEQAEVLLKVQEIGESLIDDTGCSVSELDPRHDPDKMIIYCPDSESYQKLVELFKNSEKNAKIDAAQAWLWMTWKNAKITDFDSKKGYKPEYSINTEEIPSDPNLN